MDCIYRIELSWDFFFQNKLPKILLINVPKSIVKLPLSNYTCMLKQVRNKNSNIQERSPNVVSDFPYHKELLLKERICSLLLREVSILKRDIIEENHCLIR